MDFSLFLAYLTDYHIRIIVRHVDAQKKNILTPTQENKMFCVENSVKAPEIVVKNVSGIFADLPFNAASDGADDNGLGFGQGSTAGVLNTYAKRGIHRPELQPTSRQLRRRFNLRGYRGTNRNCGSAYACHYDPAPYFDEKGATSDSVWADHQHLSQSQSRGKKVFVVIAVLVTGVFILSQR